MGRKLSEFWGNLPRHPQQKSHLDRKTIAAQCGITVKLLFKAYLNWQDIFRFEESTLTFEQYLNKLTEAGLSPADIGNNEGQYNLSRYFDQGAYTNNNCRFITRKENLLEQFHG